jgi:hypothetical protein
VEPAPPSLRRGAALLLLGAVWGVGLGLLNIFMVKLGTAFSVFCFGLAAFALVLAVLAMVIDRFATRFTSPS